MSWWPRPSAPWPVSFPFLEATWSWERNGRNCFRGQRLTYVTVFVLLLSSKFVTIWNVTEFVEKIVLVGSNWLNPNC